MAKSSSFFGLRRGSTKSLTFSVLNGEQITKDRVTYIRNPKTALQADQRMRMTLAKNFWKFNKSTLDHAFEGYRQGLQNFQQFMKTALSQPCMVYQKKGSQKFIPAPFIYSNGSLAECNVSIFADENSRSAGFDKYCVRFPNASTFNNWSVATGGATQESVESFAASINAQVGDQLTLVIAYDDTSATAGDEVNLDNLKYFETRGFITLSNDYIQFFEVLEEEGFAICSDEDSNEIGAFCFKKGGSAKNILGAVLIISRYDSGRKLWLRSNSVYAIAPIITEQFGSDTAYQQAIASYQTSESAGSSDLYLNDSANIVVKRLAVSIAESAISQVNGQRILVGYDGTGAKLGITNTAGNVYSYDGTVLTYTPAEGTATPVTASDITNWTGLTVVALTASQVQALL